jgi:hypothetical protein
MITLSCPTVPGNLEAELQKLNDTKEAAIAAYQSAGSGQQTDITEQ